jgi:hypothetical protein
MIMIQYDICLTNAENLGSPHLSLSTFEKGGAKAEKPPLEKVENNNQ